MLIMISDMKRASKSNIVDNTTPVLLRGCWYINGCQVPRSSLTKKGEPRKVKRCATCGRVYRLIEFSKLRCHPYYCLGLHCFKCRNKRTEERYRLAPAKRKGNLAVKRALDEGILKREWCVVCAKHKRKPERWEWAVAHHTDYSRPLDITWLCHRHHKAWHKLFLADV